MQGMGFLAAATLGLAALIGAAAQAAPAHGIAMHGAPALEPGFRALPYANPEAPKGGRIVFGEVGGFDSLNPYIVKGRAPWAVRTLTVESLMGRSWDEPFSLYGLLAESVETPPDRSWVAFTLRPEARFSDGSPVTLDDVVWSMRTLGEQGLPGFRSSWRKVSAVERLGPRTVRFRFSEPDREMPLILGLRPILKKDRFAGRDFAQTTLEPLIGSGPYVVEAFEPGRFISFRRNPDYWGAHLGLNAGRHNFDEVRYEYFKDDNARFEAFKAGLVTIFRESDPVRWAQGYDFAAVREGLVVKEEIPNGRPSGMTGFVFNTRRPPFDDRRVRQALALAFDFEWINRTLHGGAYERIHSFFGNSELGFRGPLGADEARILGPHAAALAPEARSGAFAWPRSDGSGRNRANLRRARDLLAEAGWRVRDGVLRDADGRPLRFEILLSGPQYEAAAAVFADALRVLGVEARLRVVDPAQYQQRLTHYDYDMIVAGWAMSLSPGNEQRFYWGREGVRQPGTRNYMGVDDPAVEAAVDALLAAEDRPTFVAAARALDRALTTGVYVIPLWRSPVSRLAHRADLRHPERLPLYGDWTGFLPDVWWQEPR
ncbi:peptide/nickel transport system substrate-binding protein [Oceanicella actignis]|nr:peptide/nickel transport system substrate-binding protein [Oceanicella actignis]